MKTWDFVYTWLIWNLYPIGITFLDELYRSSFKVDKLCNARGIQVVKLSRVSILDCLPWLGGPQSKSQWDKDILTRLEKKDVPKEWEER